jgi:hypothetical protein
MAARWLFVLSVVCLTLAAGLAARPASAATAFSLASDGSFGWCVRNRADNAASCADSYCRNTGATDCRIVVTCADGPSAVAKPDAPLKGIAIACGFNSPNWARMMALAACMQAVNDLCWTDATIAADGDEMDAALNEVFDRLFYAQSLLQLRSYKVDAVTGEGDTQTTLAIAAFQRDVGLPETGTTDPPLLFHLLAAAGGRQVEVDAARTSVIEPNAAFVASNIHAESAAPLPRRDFITELAAMAPDDQRAAMITSVRASGVSCRDPVSSAVLPDVGMSMFVVTCADQENVVIQQEGGGRFISSTPRTTPSDPAPANAPAAP